MWKITFEKVSKCRDFEIDIRRMWHLKTNNHSLLLLEFGDYDTKQAKRISGTNFWKPQNICIAKEIIFTGDSHILRRFFFQDTDYNCIFFFSLIARKLISLHLLIQIFFFLEVFGWNLRRLYITKVKHTQKRHTR